MSVVITLAAAMLGVAGVLLLVRMTVGPTILDRSVALDVLMAVTICGVGLHAASSDSSVALPLLLALSMVGFVGAVSIARYASGSDDVAAEDDDDQRGAER
ncbi:MULTISPECIES: monovalent cation/H+ antiporter complex subunit F [Nocardioides]|uniref:Multicomponent Na+:H+ antiporter subunit F n=1 Tax=Nocardioides lianchengensis TaxID=1045774 RepID=A0A1G6YP95_9ACTN|nr:monovalent cation/H+ antiporter complex subunit F [Nocardioides lianchengensis]NYG09576.1 multicomponent Na+:H+ antiporter subunit F [Nocardioides lianchengensis]SDD92219.1 multicomponent Na+:H+ antiporter subunit F [Nocardioides lianchengensis]